MADTTPSEGLQKSAKRLADQLETSSLDNRSYRVIELPNKLEVLLVSDVETDRASATMNVNVGSLSDPAEMPGLAHAVEHLLFMGSQKYPELDAYKRYIHNHSGSYNAFTSPTSTVFHFELAAKTVDDASVSEAKSSPLYGALDRFSRFFIDPKFSPSAVGDELNAVDSEHKMYLQDDLWRLTQLCRSLSNPKHPYSRFNVGNLKTLKATPEQTGVNIQEEFVKFYENNYSANRMKLVVMGMEPLDILEEWISGIFASVKNKSLPQNQWNDERLLREEDLLTQTFAKPIKDMRKLIIWYPFLDEELYEFRPGNLIAHLIGHEGPGSIMSYIKSKGWADGLSSGSNAICPGTPGLFQCTIQLTKEGLKHYEEIVKIVFQYISLLHDSLPLEWIFEEKKRIAELKFRFSEKTPASELTKSTSATMQTALPRKWLLSGKSMPRNFDPITIKEALACLHPDSFKLFIISQDTRSNWHQREQWYNTEYTCEKIPAGFLAEIKRAFALKSGDRLPELHLPHRNEFIPTALKVKEVVGMPSVAPKLIRNDGLVRVWFQKDPTFQVPKASLFIKCKSPLLSSNIRDFLKARLYTSIVKDTLEEHFYNAQLAGLRYDIQSSLTGLEIQMKGYNDKLLVLLEIVLTKMRYPEIRSDRFEIIKEHLARVMKNHEFERPSNQIHSHFKLLTYERFFPDDRLYAEIEQLTHEDIKLFYTQLLQQMRVEILVHGNLNKEDALRVNELVENILKPRFIPDSQIPTLRCFLLPPGSNFVYPKTLKDQSNVDHCIGYYLYIGDRADRILRVKALLLEQMLSAPAFHQLRTKEQLGYGVWTDAIIAPTIIAYRIIIQSERPPEYLETRIDSFLQNYLKTIQDMSEAEFVVQKRSAITKCSEKSQNLSQESDRLWGYISWECYDFNFVSRDAACFESLTKSDMVEFFQYYISPSSEARAKLAVHLYAQGVSGDLPLVDSTCEPIERSDPDVIDKIEEYKSHLSLSLGFLPKTDLSEFEELD